MNKISIPAGMPGGDAYCQMDAAQALFFNRTERHARAEIPMG